MKVISTEKIPIKMWLENIEDGAEQQAKNLANLEFAFKHIAIMPDAHRGFGMPIGGVLATKGVVIPNAVGVDIGCFTGDTKVSLLDGTNKTMLELLNKTFWVYSINSAKEVVPGKATCLKTRQNAELVNVHISGGEIIECTPDHSFMLVDGSYKDAGLLKSNDRLMPLYRSYCGNCERVWTNKGSSKATHKLVSEYFNGKSEVIHHLNINQFDNRPENLKPLTAKEHSKLHGTRFAERTHTKEVKLKRLKSLQCNGFYDKKFSEKKKEVGRQNWKKYSKSKKFKEQCLLAGSRGKKYLIERNKSEKGRLKSREIANRLFTCDICQQVVKSPIGLHNHRRKVHSNHSVIRVEKVKTLATVYCLQVEKYHNFALAAGVFVHNCGMCAVKTSLTEIDVETLKKIMNEIRKRIPVGFNHHKEAQNKNLMPEKIGKDSFLYPIVNQQYESALKQIGTLGGGNHFIEIQKGNDEHIWIMIHSGSRNFGLKIADYYNKLAKELNKKWHAEIEPKWDLAFLPMDSEEGQNYLREMQYAVDFALANRKMMMDIIKGIFVLETECHGSLYQTNCPNPFDEMINIAHNYASLENHFGENVMVHRKGATLATTDTIGIVPGSQGSKSYIVKGKGNKESFNSCSHGAGRKMSPSKAKETLNFAEEVKAMEDKGILHTLRGEGDLGEAPGSYKDIGEVMENQKDLVEILVELQPLAVIKG